VLGENHPEVAAAMQTAAEVMLDLGRYSEVEKLCGRAAAILQPTAGSASRRAAGGPAASGLRALLVAQTMQALALVLMGRPSEAEALARGCLEAAEAQLPSEGAAGADRDRLIASASNCLSEALRELGRLDEAEAACRKGLALREKVRPGGSGALPLGGCSMTSGAVGKSFGAPTSPAPTPAFVALSPQEFGPDHPAVALSLQSLALVLRARQQLPAAAEAATRCLGIRAQHKSTADGPLMASALNLKVHAPAVMPRMGRAWRPQMPTPPCIHLHNACAVTPCAAPSPPPTPCQTPQALVALDSGDAQEALSLAQKGLEIRQKALASDHPDLAQSLACERRRHARRALR
jgi:tetratricopeptide (TPR) repeat protein